MLVWYTSLTDFHCLIAGVVDKNIYSQLFSNAVVSDFKKNENVQWTMGM